MREYRGGSVKQWIEWLENWTDCRRYIVVDMSLMVITPSVVFIVGSRSRWNSGYYVMDMNRKSLFRSDWSGAWTRALPLVFHRERLRYIYWSVDLGGSPIARPESQLSASYQWVPRSIRNKVVCCNTDSQIHPLQLRGVCQDLILNWWHWLINLKSSEMNIMHKGLMTRCHHASWQISAIRR